MMSVQIMKCQIHLHMLRSKLSLRLSWHHYHLVLPDIKFICFSFCFFSFFLPSFSPSLLARFLVHIIVATILAFKQPSCSQICNFACSGDGQVDHLVICLGSWSISTHRIVKNLSVGKQCRKPRPRYLHKLHRHCQPIPTQRHMEKSV